MIIGVTEPQVNGVSLEIELRLFGACLLDEGSDAIHFLFADLRLKVVFGRIQVRGKAAQHLAGFVAKLRRSHAILPELPHQQ